MSSKHLLNQTFCQRTKKLNQETPTFSVKRDHSLHRGSGLVANGCETPASPNKTVTAPGLVLCLPVWLRAAQWPPPDHTKVIPSR